MKNFSTILNLFLFTVIVLNSGSCKKKEPKPEYYNIPISDEAKSYLLGQAGSYWIYKNTKTGDLDTQTCLGFSLDTNISKGTTEETKHITSEWERITRYISSSFNNRVYFDQTRLKEPDDPYFKNGYTILNRRTSGGNNTPFFHPFDLSAGFGSGSSSVHCVGMDSTLIIQGKTYTNVVKFNIAIDGIVEDKINCTYFYSNNIYYWAQNVGLIKKEMITCNSAWELIEYNIIK